jgi:FkbM family methyltransferase
MLPSFSRACAGTVYAFEPVLENYVLAKLCVEQNGLANVALFNAGLSDQLGVGRVDTGSSVHRGGGSEISDYGQPTTMISIDALDLANLSVLQLDVEGHEISALRGAERTIRRCRPVILIEDYKKLCGTLLESLGYQQSGKIPGLEIWLHASGVK